MLPSYEGQMVSGVELAGRPDLNAFRFMPLLAVHVGERFSQSKVDQSIAALQRTAHFNNVQRVTVSGTRDQNGGFGFDTRIKKEW